LTIISEILHVRNKIWQKISYKLINRFNYKINKPFLRPSHIGLVSVAQEANGKFSFSFIVSLSPELCHYNFCPLKACFPCFYWVWYIWCMNNRVHAHEFIIFFVDIEFRLCKSGFQFSNVTEMSGHICRKNYIDHYLSELFEIFVAPFRCEIIFFFAE